METSRWLAFWLPARPILFRRFARQPSDGGGVNSRVYTGRAISPTHARTRSRATIAQRRGTQDIGSDGERSRSYLDRGGRTLGFGARRAHRAATPYKSSSARLPKNMAVQTRKPKSAVLIGTSGGSDLLLVHGPDATRPMTPGGLAFCTGIRHISFMVTRAKSERRERPTGRTGLDGHGGQPAADLLSGMRYAVQIASQRLFANAS
jgi:hypothetical protein